MPKMFRGLICEAFLSASFQFLLEKLASPEVVSYLLGKKESNFNGLLQRVKMIVTTLSVVLDDAEERQIRDNPDVETWLDSVQEAVFIAEDLLDEIETDALRLKSGFFGSTEVPQPKRQKLFVNLFSGSGDSSSGRGGGGGGDVEGRVKKLVERLEEIAKQKDVLGLRDSVAEKKPWQRLASTSLVESCEVCGRDDDRSKLMELLFDDDDSGAGNVSVIPIVGMGGIGKTTLAQLVFNDPRVKERFAVMLWVCVSEEFDVLRVTRTLLDSDSSSCFSDLNSLQVKLREKLSGKKFFIVLDDVWNESYLDWDVLSLPFRGGAVGSKIIVSTRSSKVASVMGTVPSHQLVQLSDGACWKLFVKHACGVRDFTENSELERIGWEIVGKCRGLPLAVKTLGGVLRCTMDVGEWERVSKSDLWELPNVQSQILPALRLSYLFLPPPLKRCFAYCSIFPKDYEFDKDELVLLWMAENLLVSRNQNISMEEVGSTYFDDLVSRSFLQRSRNTYNKSVFVIHDLLIDLAKWVSKKYCFLSQTSGSVDEVSIAQARHFAFVPKQHYPYERFGSVFRAVHLRTFLPVKSMFSSKNLSNEVVEDLLSKLTRLRALSLSGYENIVQIPNSIGDLMHLRYLNLSSTSINSLPESTTRMYNLQTLKLAFCARLTELPKYIHYLSNLRYLDVTSSGLKELPESLSLLSSLQVLKLSHCRSVTKLPKDFHCLVTLKSLELGGSSLEGMPIRISELRSLKTLSTFVVGRDHFFGAKIGELGELSNLRGTLHIKNLQNVAKPEEAGGAALREKKYLEVLHLEWGKRNNESKHERDALEYLNPNITLRQLVITGYRGRDFPNWLGDNSFRNMVDITLLNCSRCVSLPPLGQLSSLKNLQIRGFDKVVNVGSEFYGKIPFKSLELLEIKQMPNWKEWSSPVSEPFPKLRKLSLQCCNSLTGVLPLLLPSLQDLNISMCDQLVPSFPAMPYINKMELKMCQNLSRITESNVLESFNRLQRLEISANSLSIQLNRLPDSIKSLKIQSYRSLEFRLDHPTNSLEELSIECSDEGSFTPSFSLDSFPNLRTFRVGGCQTLETLWTSSSESLKSLSKLEISNVPDSRLFPKTSPSFPNLTSLAVRHCRKIKFISKHLHSLAPSLESMAVKGCSEMESFSKSGLPLGLRHLTIENCDNLMASRRNWNLQRLDRLEELTIGQCDCDDMERFPEEGLLPSAIVELSIWYLECLEILDNDGLRELTSLKQLFIYDCPNLETMTDEPLPGSVESLRIKGCPLFQEKCRNKTGLYWDKISHVPWIYIDYKLVS